ncbi:glycosyltransferase family 4 protein [Pontibacter ruber]|uniref:Glycosyltransferase family 4 protein n=1 Tax=Pontibacter ruber TaxID=1343895 RepID=A0ABW5CU33_9BACT|nr:glycosyltransferase family 4 protein [Pontibacter ruber]
MIIGVSGPVDLRLLEWDLKETNLPATNAFPLTSHFINGLLRRGYKVIAYTNSTELEEPLVLESGNLKVCVGRQRPQPGRRFFNFEIEDLKNLMLAHPADFISAFWTYEFAWAALKTGIPTAVSIHDNAHKILFQQPDMFRFVRWIMNKIVLKKADHLMANSAYTYSLLGRKQKAKAVTINNFYASDLESSLNRNAEKGNYIVSAIQGFTKRKNVHGALFAFAKLRERYPDLEYHLVGLEMEENGLAHQFARKHNLDAGVRFIGVLPFNEVFQHIAGAKVLLHPSYEESFGMAVLEAMVAGTPVVGGKNSGFVPHLLNYGKAGLLCDIKSPDSMAGSVAKLLSDRSLREEIVQNARTHAQSNFSEPVVIDKHLAFYSKILGKELEPSPVSAAPTRVNITGTSWSLMAYVSSLLIP